METDKKSNGALIGLIVIIIILIVGGIYIWMTNQKSAGGPQSQAVPSQNVGTNANAVN